MWELRENVRNREKARESVRKCGKVWGNVGKCAKAGANVRKLVNSLVCNLLPISKGLLFCTRSPFPITKMDTGTYWGGTDLVYMSYSER